MALAGQCGVNLDYTKTMNLFGEVGALWLAESKMGEREKHRDIISKYIDYDKLEEDIIVDWGEFEEFRKWKSKKNSGRKTPAIPTAVPA
jgi:hypothetical protein